MDVMVTDELTSLARELNGLTDEVLDVHNLFDAFWEVVIGITHDSPPERSVAPQPSH